VRDLGRLLEGAPDALTGYKLVPLAITAPKGWR
jgi:hypothetical protein